MKLYKKLLGNRFFTDGFIHVAGNGFSKVSVYICTLLFAHSLTPANFGDFSYFQNTIMTVTSIGTTGFSASAIYFANKYSNKEFLSSSVFMLGVGIIIASIIVFMSQAFGFLTLIDSYYLVVSLVVFSILQGVMLGLKKIALLSIFNIALSLLYLIAVYIFRPNSTLDAIDLFVIYKYISSGIMFLWFVIYFRRGFLSLTIRGIILNKLEVLKFSIPVCLSGLLVAPVLWYGNFTLVNIENGNELLGNYNLGYQVYLIIIFIPASLSPIILSYFSNEKNSSVFNYTLVFNILIVAVLSFLFHVVVSVISLDIMRKYTEVSSLLPYFYISAIIYTINSIVGQKVLSIGKAKTAFSFNLIWGLAYIISVNITVQHIPTKSLALSLVFSYMVQFLFQSGYLYFKKDRVAS